MSKVKTPVLNLANKYRPSKFSELVGQDHVTRIVEHQLKNNSLPPCIILYGVHGCGKTSLARLIAKALNPSEQGIIEKNAATYGGKDNIRLLETEVYNRPFVGEYKTYIFDEAHGITKQAFESLLKITEEPPEHVRFIFVTTDFEKIPLTIKSRCQVHSFNRISNSLIKKNLKEILKKEKQDMPEELITLATDAAAGSMRDAIVALETIITSYLTGQTEVNIANSLGIISSKKYTDFILNYVFEDFNSLHTNSAMFSPENTDIQKAIFNLQQFIIDCRYSVILPSLIKTLKSDVSIFISKVDEKLASISQDKINSYKKFIGGRLDTMYDLSLELERDIKYSANKEAAIGRFIIKLAKSWSNK